MSNPTTPIAAEPPDKILVRPPIYEHSRSLDDHGGERRVTFPAQFVQLSEAPDELVNLAREEQALAAKRAAEDLELERRKTEQLELLASFESAQAALDSRKRFLENFEHQIGTWQTELAASMAARKAGRGNPDVPSAALTNQIAQLRIELEDCDEDLEGLRKSYLDGCKSLEKMCASSGLKLKFAFRERHPSIKVQQP